MKKIIITLSVIGSVIISNAQKVDSTAIKDSIATEKIVLQGQDFLFGSVSDYLQTKCEDKFLLKEYKEFMNNLRTLLEQERKYYLSQLRKKK